jgi:hypothetical protein
LTGFRPRNFSLETIAGKIEQKAAWFWSLVVDIVKYSLQCDTDGGCSSEEWGGRVSWIAWNYNEDSDDKFLSLQIL